MKSIPSEELQRPLNVSTISSYNHPQMDASLVYTCPVTGAKTWVTWVGTCGNDLAKVKVNDTVTFVAIRALSEPCTFSKTQQNAIVNCTAEHLISNILAVTGKNRSEFPEGFFTMIEEEAAHTLGEVLQSYQVDKKYE